MVESLDCPIEVNIRKGADYMSPRKRGLYCQFQYPEYVTELVTALTADVPSGPRAIDHIGVLSQYVKTNISYENTGPFPRGIDYMLSKGEAGDCVDQSVLLVSLLEAAGHTARFCCVHRHGQSTGHCVVQTKGSEDPTVRSRMGEELRSRAGLTERFPVSWDHADDGVWLLIDPTSQLPPGFDRGNEFEVERSGIHWDDDIDLICFRKHESQNTGDSDSGQ